MKKAEDSLDQSLKKFLGLPPYNHPANILYGDGYYYKSLIDKFGEESVRKVEERIKYETDIV